MSQQHQSIFKSLLDKAKSIPGVDLRGIEIPPKIFLEMDAKVIDYVENESLTIRFPVKEKYQNPFGHMQGGMIVTAIDNVFGPLSFILAPPSVTTHLNTQYLRPVTKEQKYIEIKASLIEKTKNQLFLNAKVFNEKGKLMAISQATFQVIGRV